LHKAKTTADPVCSLQEALITLTLAKVVLDRLTAETKIRKGNFMIASTKWLKTAGLISLGGGLPSSVYCPSISKLPLHTNGQFFNAMRLCKDYIS
jgi:hypothetical protein